jgi:hypothetical protein
VSNKFENADQCGDAVCLDTATTSTLFMAPARDDQNNLYCNQIIQCNNTVSENDEDDNPYDSYSTQTPTATPSPSPSPTPTQLSYYTKSVPVEDPQTGKVVIHQQHVPFKPFEPPTASSSFRSTSPNSSINRYEPDCSAFPSIPSTWGNCTGTTAEGSPDYSCQIQKGSGNIIPTSNIPINYTINADYMVGYVQVGQQGTFTFDYQNAIATNMSSNQFSHPPIVITSVFGPHDTCYPNDYNYCTHSTSGVSVALHNVTTTSFEYTANWSYSAWITGNNYQPTITPMYNSGITYGFFYIAMDLQPKTTSHTPFGGVFRFNQNFSSKTAIFVSGDCSLENSCGSPTNGGITTIIDSASYAPYYVTMLGGSYHKGSNHCQSVVNAFTNTGTRKSSSMAVEKQIIGGLQPNVMGGGSLIFAGGVGDCNSSTIDLKTQGNGMDVTQEFVFFVTSYNPFSPSESICKDFSKVVEMYAYTYQGEGVFDMKMAFIRTPQSGDICWEQTCCPFYWMAIQYLPSGNSIVSKK